MEPVDSQGILFKKTGSDEKVGREAEDRGLRAGCQDACVFFPSLLPSPPPPAAAMEAIAGGGGVEKVGG